MSIVAGIDVGGTFTDLVLFDPATETVRLAKTPTTPENQAFGVLAAPAAGIRPSEIGLVATPKQLDTGGEAAIRRCAIEDRIRRCGVMQRLALCDRVEHVAHGILGEGRDQGACGTLVRRAYSAKPGDEPRKEMSFAGPRWA